MNRRRLLLFSGILFAIVGLVGIVLSVFQEEKNQMLLNAGLLCNSVAFVILCIANRKKK